MSNKTKIKEILRHKPLLLNLPAHFEEFLIVDLPVRVQWEDLDTWNLKEEAASEALPFLRTSTGGIVALWYHTHEPCVVLFGDEGELIVLASDFDNFLKGVASKQSGLHDIDSGEEVRFPFPVTGLPDREKLPDLEVKFKEWEKRNTLIREPLQRPDTEILRQQICRIASEMLQTGLSKVYKPSSSWWSMNFTIYHFVDELRIEYLDYGSWYPVPTEYGLTEIVRGLLKYVKNPYKPSYEMLVLRMGHVSFDRGRELVLDPPKENEQP